MHTSRVSWLAVVAAAVFLCGCAGYRLGPTNGQAAGEKSVEVIPFANQTLEPRLTDAVTTQVRKEIVRDGTYRLASHHDGDILLSGSIVDYDRKEAGFSSRDNLTVTDFRMTLVAEVTATERSSGRSLFKQRVTGRTLVRAGTDLVSSERQALPLLSEDLARNITALLADGSW